MTATPPASTVSGDVPTSLASLMMALAHPLAPPSMAPPTLPAVIPMPAVVPLPAVVPAGISSMSGEHVVELLVRRIEDQFAGLERMRLQSEAQASELERRAIETEQHAKEMEQLRF